MAEQVDSVGPVRRRADARRSVEAILDAARSVLGGRPDASMEDVAAAASVTRQTVYAHFPSRDALLAAVFNSVVAEGVAAIEDAKLDALSPPVALQTFLTISHELVRRYPSLLDPALVRAATPAGGDPHDPFAALLERLTRRGQRTGAFDRTLPPKWLVAATFSLSHAAAERVTAGQLPQARAAKILQESVLRLYGLPAVPSGRPRP